MSDAPRVTVPAELGDTNDLCSCSHFMGWHHAEGGGVFGMCLWPNGWPDKRECKCNAYDPAPPPVPVSDEAEAWADVRAERQRQDAKWGQQDCHDFEWASILMEEVGEAATEANEANFTSGKNRGDWSKLRTELVQVAAVAVAWVEAIDRRAARQAGKEEQP